MIPKIIHQIWIGWNNMKNDYINFSKGWIDLHPDFQYKLWGDTNINELKYLDLKKLKYCKNITEKVDYIRICILLEIGGLYIDLDFECCKNMSSLLEDCKLIIWQEGPDILSNAFIGCEPENEIINEIYCNFDKIIHKKRVPTRIKTGPIFVSKIINKNKDKIKILPGHYLYSEYWNNIYAAKINPGEVFAIHKYDFSGEKYFISKKIFNFKKKISNFWLGLITCRIYQKISNLLNYLRLILDI